MTPLNSPAPAIHLEVILPRIIQQYLCEGDACELALDGNFVHARFRAHQIYYLQTFGLNRLHKRLAIKAIARAFDVQSKDVRHALEKGETILKGRAEHLALEVDTEQYLIDWIPKNAQNHTTVNRTELLHYCGKTFGVVVTPERVNSFLFRHKLEQSETIRRPHKKPRLEVPRSFLDTMIASLSEYLPGCCAELVFNLDEICISE
jgi:hypothetical protein